jgi:hypothetical protein
MLTGCFGGFAATRALWEWNDDFGNKWVKWLVFLGLSILPIYSLFVLADVLVLNSVEFWTGSNPVAHGADGRTYARLPTNDPRTVRVEVRRDGRLEHVAHFRRLDGQRLQLLDQAGAVLADVRERQGGQLQLRDARGKLLLELSAAQAQKIESAILAGRAAPLALHDAARAADEQLAQGIERVRL